MNTSIVMRYSLEHNSLVVAAERLVLDDLNLFKSNVFGNHRGFIKITKVQCFAGCTGEMQCVTPKIVAVYMPFPVLVICDGYCFAQTADVVERFHVGHVHNEYPLVDDCFSIEPDR